MSLTDYGYTKPPARSESEIPRTCWTCLKPLLVMSGMTTCYALKDMPNHTKMGIEPCKEYELDPIWFEVGSWFPPKKWPSKFKRGRR